MTGIFNSRPILPRYDFTWQTSIVINYLKGLNYDNLSYKLLSYKIVTLLSILSGQRVSTVHKFRLSQLHITKDIAIFTISSLLKHTKPGKVNLPVTFYQYPYGDPLCPVKLLNKYISYRKAYLWEIQLNSLLLLVNRIILLLKAQWQGGLKISCISVGLTQTFSNHIGVVQLPLAKYTLLVFQVRKYSNADSGVLIVYFTNFIVRTFTGMITQKVLNFLTAFCLQLIVRKTFCPLHFKASLKGLYIQCYCLC